MRISVEIGIQIYFWNNRTLVNYGDCKFGVVISFDICDGVLQKSNVLFGYNVDSNS